MKKRYKENTGNFIRKLRRGMLVIIMAGIFLTVCGNRNEEEAKVTLAEELAAKRTDENAWAFDYLTLLDELEQDEYFSADGTEYKLIYLDGDILALAAGHTGYAVSVFYGMMGRLRL